MDDYTERRHHVRVELREPLMASAELAGTFFPAVLVDLSESGARFRFPECETSLSIKPGNEANWTVCLPSGTLTKFRAVTRWFQRLPDDYVIGVECLDAIQETLFQDVLHNNPLPA